jgi:exosome complex component RRP42
MVILMSETIKIVNSENVLTKIKEGKRLDDRGFNDYRSLEVKVGNVKSAGGSSWVKLGDTEIVCGIKFVVGTPYPDSPDEGSMSLNLELTGLSSPDFNTGPPQIGALEYGRVADRAIRHADAIDFKELSIIPGEKSFTMFIDCYAINADGNLIDATEIAALAAIMNARIPKLDENNVIVPYEYTKKINLKTFPLSFTFEKVGDKIILDANELEEFASSTRFSLGINKNAILSCHKSKGGIFTSDEINYMIDTATSKYNEMEKIIRNAIKE